VDGLKQLDLAKEGAQVINADVEKATRGMIKEMINEIDPDAKLILVNALYFKGFWKKAFDKNLISLQDFTLETGKKKQVWMMRDGEGWLIYGDQLNFKASAVLLDYRASSSQSSSKSIQMLIILPDEGVSLDCIEQQLNTEALIGTLSSVMCREVKVSLPRFRIEAIHDLNSMICSLGAGVLFNPDKANLSGIAYRSLNVSQIIQKAVIDVDEEGTTAAAATMVESCWRSGRHIPPPFVCNRPFWFSLLIDDGAKEGKPPVILFTGSVRDPS